MWEIQPKGPPYRILRSGIPLEIEIRPAPPMSIVLFAMLFTPLWVAGSIVVLLAMMQQDVPRWFLVLWLTIWLFAGGYNLVVMWWMVAGREHLIWDRTGLLRRLRLGPFSLQWRYRAAHIRNLRVEVGPPPLRTRGGRAILPPRIAFDYGDRVVYVGLGLPQWAAEEIVQRVLQVLPEMGQNRKNTLY